MDQGNDFRLADTQWFIPSNKKLSIPPLDVFSLEFRAERKRLRSEKGCRWRGVSAVTIIVIITRCP